MPHSEQLKFLEWAKDIFREYADLKPDDCDSDESQQETYAALQKEASYLANYEERLRRVPPYSATDEGGGE